MKRLITFLIIVLCSAAIADNSLFVHDSMFAYYINLGDRLLVEYRADHSKEHLFWDCSNAYAKAIEVNRLSKNSSSLKTVTSNFKYASSIIELDTISGNQSLRNFNAALHHFGIGMTSLKLRLNFIAMGKHDNARWLAILRSYDPYFNSYIWLYTLMRNDEKANEIKRDIERLRLLFE